MHNQLRCSPGSDALHFTNFDFVHRVHNNSRKIHVTLEHSATFFFSTNWAPNNLHSRKIRCSQQSPPCTQSAQVFSRFWCSHESSLITHSHALLLVKSSYFLSHHNPLAQLGKGNYIRISRIPCIWTFLLGINLVGVQNLFFLKFENKNIQPKAAMFTCLE